MTTAGHAHNAYTSNSYPFWTIQTDVSNLGLDTPSGVIRLMRGPQARANGPSEAQRRALAGLNWFQRNLRRGTRARRGDIGAPAAPVAQKELDNKIGIKLGD
jgi:hypothetical protein